MRPRPGDGRRRSLAGASWASSEREIRERGGRRTGVRPCVASLLSPPKGPRSSPRTGLSSSWPCARPPPSLPPRLHRRRLSSGAPEVSKQKQPPASLDLVVLLCLKKTHTLSGKKSPPEDFSVGAASGAEGGRKVRVRVKSQQEVLEMMASRD